MSDDTMQIKEHRVGGDAPPFPTILVPLDGSPLAEQALPLAAAIARPAGSRLRLALVHQLADASLDPTSARIFNSIELATRKSERSYLRGVQARLRADGARLASAVTLTGAVGQTLARYVQELGIDLVVMATHGRGGVQRAWLGSVADHLVRHLVIPVLLVRPPEGRASTAPTPGHQILVPLDGSPLAEEVLRPAEALGRLWQAELCLVQVVRPVLRVVDLAAPLPTAYDDELTAVRRTQAQDYLDDVAAGLRARGLRATIAAVVGWHPAQTILDLARPERVALVALATHGRGGLRRWALGSVADKLVRGVDVPVLVQRPSAPAKRQRTRRGPRAGTRKGGDDVR